MVITDDYSSFVLPAPAPSLPHTARALLLLVLPSLFYSFSTTTTADARDASAVVAASARLLTASAGAIDGVSARARPATTCDSIPHSSTPRMMRKYPPSPHSRRQLRAQDDSSAKRQPKLRIESVAGISVGTDGVHWRSDQIRSGQI